MREPDKELEYLRGELALYEKAYRGLLDQVNAMEPDLRVLQLRQALSDERQRRRRISTRLKTALDKLAQYEKQEYVKTTAIERSIRRHQKRSQKRRRRRKVGRN